MTLLFVILALLTPVRWNGVQQGDSVTLTAEVDSGWHLTLIALGDSAVEDEYTSSVSLTFPADRVPTVRYVTCDDEQCLSPEVYNYTAAAPLPTQEGNRVGLLFLLGLLGGLLAIFTPCIWPVIPMTVSFFLKRGGGVRSALYYGLSIIVIYVGLGLLVTVLFGASALNALSTNAVVNLFFFALFVLFALSFFGLFEITLPESWSSHLDSKARTSSGLLSILFMAFTLVVVSFSCTGPIIGTLLVEAAGKSLLAPAFGMLGFALALAIPFSLFALFPDVMRRLPKSGEWMQAFKVTLAFIELALSLKFLSVADTAYGWGLLARPVFFLIWIVLFVALAVYHLIDALRHRPLPLVRRIIKAVLIVLALAFAAYLIPGLSGGQVKLVSAFAPPMPIAAQSSFSSYDEGLTYARQTGQPVLIQFTGYGCVNCRKMETYVLSDDRVQSALAHYVLITLYVDSRMDNDKNGIPDGEENSRLQRERFGSNAQPYWVQTDAFGNPQGTPCAFTVNPEDFLRWLQLK